MTPAMYGDELDFGETVPGVTCPDCGSDLVTRPAGGYCDWCDKYVPIVGRATDPETQTGTEIVALVDDAPEDGDEDRAGEGEDPWSSYS